MAPRGRQARCERAVRVLAHQEDRAEVGARLAQDLVAVLLGGGARVLVRQHFARAPVGRAEAGQQAHARMGPPGRLERLLDHVESRRVVGRDDAGREPGPVGASRLAIRRLPRLPVEHHADDVPRVARVQLVLVRRRDHVVRRRQDLRQVCVRYAVADSGERLDLGHVPSVKWRSLAAREVLRAQGSRTSSSTLRNWTGWLSAWRAT